VTARRMGPRAIGRAVVRGAAALKRAMYRGGRPTAFTRLVNRLDAVVYRSRFLSPRHAAVLKVVGRRSGSITSVPVAVTEHQGAEFLVSMLGPDANWVRNVHAAGGKAALCRHGRETPVVLEEVPPERRAEILRRYMLAEAADCAGCLRHLLAARAALPVVGGEPTDRVDLRSGVQPPGCLDSGAAPDGTRGRGGGPMSRPARGSATRRGRPLWVSAGPSSAVTVTGRACERAGRTHGRPR